MNIMALILPCSGFFKVGNQHLMQREKSRRVVTWRSTLDQDKPIPQSEPSYTVKMATDEKKNDFWAVAGDTLVRYHRHARLSLYAPKEE